MKSNQEVKEYTAIWNHGAKKRDLTNAINLLKKFSPNPAISDCITHLKSERIKLDSINPLEK